MTVAIVNKPFPYSVDGQVVKLKAGESFDFPAKQYRGLLAEGFIRGEGDAVEMAPAVEPELPAPEEDKKPRGRKPKAGRFRMGRDAGMVPELGE
jgi:hypothetical protein